MRRKNKKAQEEMIGFGLIIIIVLVIMMVFLWFYFNTPQPANFEDYESESFVHSVLSFTSDCKDVRQGYLPVRELIYYCREQKSCGDQNSCYVLNTTLNGILEESWDVGVEKRIKGWEFNITSSGEEIYSNKEGNLTGNFRGFSEEYPKRGEWVVVNFGAYF